VEGGCLPKIVRKRLAEGMHVNLSMVDQQDRDHEQYHQFGIHHEILDLSHPFDTPEVDPGKSPNDSDGNPFAHPVVVCPFRAADAVGREGIRIQREGGDVAKDRVPSDKRGCQMGVGVGALEKRIRRPLVLIIDSQFDIRIRGKESDNTPQRDRKGGEKADHRDGDAQDGENPTPDHPSDGNGDELFEPKTFFHVFSLNRLT